VEVLVLRSILVLSFILAAFVPLSSATDEEVGYGVPALPRPEAELSDRSRQDIWVAIERNMGLLRSTGALEQAVPIRLSWPLKAAYSLQDPGFHIISGFVDHNAQYPDKLLDYNCGTRTYDLSSGYNHKGTDIAPWPFSWYKMNNDQVEVVAAAPGVIVLREDGHADRSCAMSSGAQWNAVYVRHDDGSVAWYGHMKKDSLTPKKVGESVERGEYLGVVGSSGNSTGPHLHFELYDAAKTLVDPFGGPCNAWSSQSWWEVQRPYNDSSLLKVMTSKAPPTTPLCPQEEVTNGADTFAPGQKAYFTAFYRDYPRNDQSQFTIYRPDGSVYDRWTNTNIVPVYYPGQYWFYSRTLAQNAPTGRWRFRVDYNGSGQDHFFTVSQNRCTAALFSDFTLSIPALEYGGAYYWADLRYIPDAGTFRLVNAGAGDKAAFSGCEPARLGADLAIHIPAITYLGFTFWIDLNHTGDLIFALAGGGSD
jgi:murein DD-endopeptidase MepM/ murein hydrolase activator NlpD